MILTGKSISQIEEVKLALDKAFTIKDLGQLNYFLGIEVKRNAQGIFLSQRKYINDIITDCNMVDYIAAPAPLSAALKLSTKVGDVLEDPDVCRRLVGRLLYLGITRPDLSYAVQHLSQFMHAPRSPHLRVVMHVVRYLKCTIDQGLFYSANSNLKISAYSDSDWSACQFSNRSLSSYVVFLGSNLVSWKTKKQQTMSKSSTEA
ncbi:uncharacterized mitochondrial protein AtMg00810-like [Beta vulgaris subsp. vulgaris]|uniref:uncharacterized mitochondrial protein AtMg00810-like n=1 Tax=Beta vulgaris subsp. vulgaris TaxID=3555 RepID=UPI00090075C6|nr:uncharacterized mitochondrial protein AtMg00810-like [Beta vulgaris subsp. vulgaris]